MPRNASRGTAAAVTALPAGEESAMPRIIRAGVPFTKPAFRAPQPPAGRATSAHARRVPARLQPRVGRRIRRIVFRTAFDGFPGHSDGDLVILPTHVIDLPGGKEHALARQPFARVDDDGANGPALVVEHEVVDLADRTVAREDVIADNFVAASQVNILRVALLVDAALDFARDCGVDRLLRRNERLGRCTGPGVWQHRRSPESVTFPVVRVPVVVVVIDLVLAGDRLVGVDTRTVPDLLLRQFDFDDFIAPVDTAHRPRGNEHFALAQQPPVA